MENIRQQLELADILKVQAPSFLTGQKLCEVQKKAYHAIINCRTSKLGGHIQECNACAYSCDFGHSVLE